MLGVNLRDHIQNEKIRKRTMLSSTSHVRNGVGWDVWHGKTMTDGRKYSGIQGNIKEMLVVHRNDGSTI